MTFGASDRIFHLTGLHVLFSMGCQGRNRLDFYPKVRWNSFSYPLVVASPLMDNAFSLLVQLMSIGGSGQSCGSIRCV